MKFIIQIIGVILVCYCVIGVALYFFQEKMLFFPMGASFGNCPQMGRYQARAVENNGIRYYVKESGSAQNWVVVFHGNAGNACDRTYFFDLMSGFESHIALFEYPGYGGDTHKPGETVIREQALAFVKQIKERSEDLPVYLMGESMGTGVATWISTQTHVAGLILISAYTSLAKVGQHHYPWLPVKYLLQHKFPAEEWALQAQAPAVLFHGKDDDIIPIQFAREQVLNFKTKAALFEIDHCGHNDIVDTGHTLLRKEISAFLMADG